MKPAESSARLREHVGFILTQADIRNGMHQDNLANG